MLGVLNLQTQTWTCPFQFILSDFHQQNAGRSIGGPFPSIQRSPSPKQLTFTWAFEIHQTSCSLGVAPSQ